MPQTRVLNIPGTTAISPCQNRAIFELLGLLRTDGSLLNDSDHVTETADQQPPTPRTFTVAQVADILQIDQRTVRTKARTGTWPSLDFGPRTIRFTDKHLAAILSGSESPAVQLALPHRRRRRLS